MSFKYPLTRASRKSSSVIQSRFAVVFAVVLAASPTYGAPVVGSWPNGSNGNLPVTNDLFDVSQGVTIVSASAQQPNSDPRSALGFLSSFANPNESIFVDGGGSGDVSQITFKLPNLTQIGGYRFYTYDDSYIPGNSNRGITSLKLSSSTDGTVFNLVSEADIIGHPYNPNQVPAGEGVYIEDIFSSPIVAQLFRLEVTRFNSTGPRIVELDGIAPIPLPAGIWLFLSGMLGILALRRRGGG